MIEKRNYRAFRDIEEEYFRNHPEEIGSYIDEIFDEYAQDGNSASFAGFLARYRQGKRYNPSG